MECGVCWRGVTFSTKPHTKKESHNSFKQNYSTKINSPLNGSKSMPKALLSVDIMAMVLAKPWIIAKAFNSVYHYVPKVL